MQYKENTHFNQLTLPRISEGGVQAAVLLERVLSVQDIDAEVAERGPEHVLLGAVLQQAVVEGRLGNLEGEKWKFQLQS